MEDKKVLPKVNLSTENYDIISTGSVVLQLGEYLEFEIENLKFRIEFIDETPNGDTPLETKVISGVENCGTNNAYYRIAFYNQTSAFFASTANFGQLAIIAGKPLKLKFCIQAINVLENKSDKVFFYTWYLGKEEVGQLTNNVPQ